MLLNFGPFRFLRTNIKWFQNRYEVISVHKTAKLWKNLEDSLPFQQIFLWTLNNTSGRLRKHWNFEINFVCSYSISGAAETPVPIFGISRGKVAISFVFFSRKSNWKHLHRLANSRCFNLAFLYELQSSIWLKIDVKSITIELSQNCAKIQKNSNPCKYLPQGRAAPNKNWTQAVKYISRCSSRISFGWMLCCKAITVWTNRVKKKAFFCCFCRCKKYLILLDRLQYFATLWSSAFRSSNSSVKFD